MSQRLDQIRHMICSHRYCDAGAVKVCAYGLISPAQMHRKESLHERVKGHPVPWPDETMAFIRVEGIGYWNLFLLHGLDDLTGLVLIYPGIVCSLSDQYRPLNTIDI